MGGDAPAKTTAQVTGTGPATVAAYPPEYWKDTTLNLYFKTAADCSVDDEGSKKFKRKANASLTYVKDLQADLIALGYLAKGKDNGAYLGETKRAVSRFQRHAARVYRLIGATKKADDVQTSAVFAGPEDGICNPATATEIQTWKTKGWVVPLGRFAIKALTTGGRLREDVADEWEKIVTAIANKGGTLAGPYGDTLRGLGHATSTSASSFSFHCCGRAVDINQAFSPKTYAIVKDGTAASMRFRIYCKTDKQDGTQGTKMTKGQVKIWDFIDKKEISIREGYYIDLTAEIEGGGMFERIVAHTGWEDAYKQTEWWHYQYTKDKQKTFQDETELIGITEAQLKAAGYSDAELDHAPG